MQKNYYIKHIIFISTVLSIVLILTSFSAANARVNIGSIWISPKAIAMGGAYVALADDANAVFLNPAGLGNAQSELCVGYGELIGDVTNHDFMANYNLGRWGGLGIGYKSARVPMQINITDPITGLPVSVVNGDYISDGIAIAYGFPLNSVFSMGLKVHKMTESFPGINAEGNSVDMGMLINPLNNLSIGLMIMNLYSTDYIWNSGLHEKIPAGTVLGVSFRPIKGKLLLAMDVTRENLERGGNNDEYSLGIELSPWRNFGFRIGGFFTKDTNGGYQTTPSFGLAFNLWQSFQFDYAWQRPYGMKNDNHYFSINYRP